MNAKHVSVTAYHDLSIKCCNRKHKFHELEFAGFLSRLFFPRCQYGTFYELLIMFTFCDLPGTRTVVKVQVAILNPLYLFMLSYKRNECQFFCPVQQHIIIISLSLINQQQSVVYSNEKCLDLVTERKVPGN